MSILLQVVLLTAATAAAVTGTAAAQHHPFHVPALVLLTGYDPQQLLLRLLTSAEISPQQLLVVCEEDVCASNLLQVQHAQRQNERLSAAVVTTIQTGTPLHVFEVWNIVLEQHAQHPWFLFLEFDAFVQPQQLSLLIARFQRQKLDMAALQSGGACSYSIFCIRRQLWQQLGGFDTTLLPAAGAMAEWEARLQQRQQQHSAAAATSHGGGGIAAAAAAVAAAARSAVVALQRSARVQCIGSLPVVSSHVPRFWSRASELQPLNLRYVDAKWGCRDGTACTFTQAFNGSEAAANASRSELLEHRRLWRIHAFALTGAPVRRQHTFLQPLDDQHYNDGGRAIPVIATSVVADPHLFLLRLFHSIDFPVRAYVIMADLSDPLLSAQVQSIQESFANVTVVDRSKPGCAEGWNLAFKHHPEDPWYMYSAYDVMFEPGHLDRFESIFVGSNYDMAVMAARNGKFCGLNTFAYTRGLVSRAGMFDENIWPAYQEDVEWGVRTQHLVPPIKMDCITDAYYWHGQPDDMEYISGIRRQHATDYIPQEAMDAWGRINDINNMYIRAKWNCTAVGKDCFMTPFNDKRLSIGYWALNETRRQQLVDAVRARDAAFSHNTTAS